MTSSATSLSFALGAATLLTVLASSSGAQTIYGTLSGRVIDATQSAVPDATVRLINNGTNAAHDVATQADGTFQFARVTPGEYRLSVEKPGFKQHVRAPLDVAVNEQTTVDVTLDV